MTWPPGIGFSFHFLSSKHWSGYRWKAPCYSHSPLLWMTSVRSPAGCFCLCISFEALGVWVVTSSRLLCSWCHSSWPGLLELLLRHLLLEPRLSLRQASLLSFLGPPAGSFRQCLREFSWPLFGGKSLLEASLLARCFRRKPVADTRSPSRMFVGDSSLEELDLLGRKERRGSSLITWLW